MLSEDGSKVLNVWFLPHHTEMLVAYKKLSDEDCRTALTHHLTIVAALHDILQYLCTHSQLGSAQARLGSRADRQLTADWGGISGIGKSRGVGLFEDVFQVNLGRSVPLCCTWVGQFHLGEPGLVSW